MCPDPPQLLSMQSLPHSLEGEGWEREEREREGRGERERERERERIVNK